MSIFTYTLTSRVTVMTLEKVRWKVWPRKGWNGHVLLTFKRLWSIHPNFLNTLNLIESNFDLGVVFKWLHTILDNFLPPSPIVTLFIIKAFVLPSQNPSPTLTPMTVTSIMDDPSFGAHKFSFLKLYFSTNLNLSNLDHLEFDLFKFRLCSRGILL